MFRSAIKCYHRQHFLTFNLCFLHIWLSGFFRQDVNQYFPLSSWFSTKTSWILFLGTQTYDAGNAKTYKGSWLPSKFKRLFSLQLSCQIDFFTKVSSGRSFFRRLLHLLTMVFIIASEPWLSDDGKMRLILVLLNIIFSFSKPTDSKCSRKLWIEIFPSVDSFSMKVCVVWLIASKPWLPTNFEKCIYLWYFKTFKLSTNLRAYFFPRNTNPFFTFRNYFSVLLCFRYMDTFLQSTKVPKLNPDNLSLCL